MILCAGKMESFDFALPIGIGLVESAINLTQLCLFNRPEYLLFVGTAGSYGDHQLLDIVTSQGAANIELSFMQKQSYTPIDNVIVSNTGLVEHQTIVNGSNYITTDESLGRGFSKHHIGLENMEFFSVMAVAREFDIPAGGVFCVTNFCAPQAHDQFIANHKAATAKLESYARQELLPRFKLKGGA